MYWIALSPSHDDELQAWGWRGLQFTPRVARVDEALLLEVASCERLWGGRRELGRRLLDAGEVLAPATATGGTTSRVALALLRLKRAGLPKPRKLPDELPLDTLTEAREHLGTLERIGCTTWGALRALPRGGVSRRFGAALLKALDAAWGDAPEQYDWLQLPETFDLQAELAMIATSAQELMGPGETLLSRLQVWLQARNRGVLSFELEWTLDLKRLDGRSLPPTEKIVIRTAEPTQEIAHLRRLLSEQLSRSTIAAPANHVRLRSLETTPWGGLTTSLLPEDNRPGDPLHQFIERLSVRLGEDNVLVAQAYSDHRPERMQAWVPARSAASKEVTAPAVPDNLYPPWLLPQPQPLEVKGGKPCWQGPLRRLTRLYRVETGWWEDTGPSFRDYFIARSEEAGLVWIYRERTTHPGDGLRHERWFLQGVYA